MTRQQIEALAKRVKAVEEKGTRASPANVMYATGFLLVDEKGKIIWQAP